jgi:hypothetical protein
MDIRKALFAATFLVFSGVACQNYSAAEPGSRTSAGQAGKGAELSTKVPKFSPFSFPENYIDLPAVLREMPGYDPSQLPGVWGDANGGSFLVAQDPENASGLVKSATSRGDSLILEFSDSGQYKWLMMTTLQLFSNYSSSLYWESGAYSTKDKTLTLTPNGGYSGMLTVEIDGRIEVESLGDSENPPREYQVFTTSFGDGLDEYSSFSFNEGITLKGPCPPYLEKDSHPCSAHLVGDQIETAYDAYHTLQKFQ